MSGEQLRRWLNIQNKIYWYEMLIQEVTDEMVHLALDNDRTPVGCQQ